MFHNVEQFYVLPYKTKFLFPPVVSMHLSNGYLILISSAAVGCISSWVKKNKLELLQIFSSACCKQCFLHVRSHFSLCPWSQQMERDSCRWQDLLGGKGHNNKNLASVFFPMALMVFCKQIWAVANVANIFFLMSLSHISCPERKESICLNVMFLVF